MTVKKRKSGAMNIVLWVIQVLLAALFIFAGIMKLITPIEQLTAEIPIPGLFIQFIGVVEVLGALGLILPGIFRVKKHLTVSAAYGLLIIMIGAVVLTTATMGILSAIMPFIVGLLLWFVAYKRSH